MRLSERCSICGSATWCGRSCKHAPVAEKPVAAPVVVPAAEVVAGVALVACVECGVLVAGTKRRRFCSASCRVKAHRRKP